MSREVKCIALAVLAMVGSSTAAFAQEVKHIPLAAGLTLVSVNQGPSGDRENVVTVGDVSPQGASYGWTFRTQSAGVVETGTFRRFVRVEDLTSAPRLNDVFFSNDVDQFPGSTAFSFSRAVLQKLKSGVSVPYSLATVDGANLGAGWAGAIGGEFLKIRVYARGTLAMAQSPPTRMSLLVNGRRSTVPVVHARGSFTLRGEKIECDFLMLDDAEHPLWLRAVSGGAVFQMIRVDFPDNDNRSVATAVEADLESKCRAEIPGVYFEFGSADLRAESEAALAEVGRALGTHPDWKLSIEGHTDAVGSPAANLALSQRRAEAVRTALTTRYHVAASRLTAAGFGQTKPKEPNTSLEGRARNRRVEMVRPCSARP